MLNVCIFLMFVVMTAWVYGKLDIQGVHCDMLESKCTLWAEKLISQA